MATPNLKTVNIGRKIQRVRELRGMKQDALASKLGITQQAVSHLERSETIDDDKLKRVAEALEVTPDFLENFKEDAVFTNNVYSDNNTIGQIYSQPISKIEVYNQINHPLDKVVELYEKLLKERDEIIAKQQEVIDMFKKKAS